MLQLALSQLPPGSKLLYLTHFGSKLYGTDTPSSDTDLKGIYLPNIKDVVLNRAINTVGFTTGDAISKNKDTDVDITLYSLQYFMELITSGEVGAIDLLFSMFRADTIIYEEKPTVDYLRTNYEKLISKQSKRFVGYCFNQAAKYGIKGSRYGDLLSIHEYLQTVPNDNLSISTIKDKIPTLQHVSVIQVGGLDYIQILGKLHQTNLMIHQLKYRIEKALDSYGHRTRSAFTTQGVDWKALSHAYRVIYQMQQLATTNNIVFPLAIADKLRTIKINTDASLLQPILDDIATLLEQVSKSVDASSLPNDVDTVFIDEFVLQNYNL